MYLWKWSAEQERLVYGIKEIMKSLDNVLENGIQTQVETSL